MVLIKAIHILFGLFSYTVAQICPNSCSGHGVCNSPDLRCKCFDGWTGGDCSLRTCPSDIAWVDAAVAIDDAHNEASCSNMGICQKQTGTCSCNINYSGSSCEKLDCQNGCNGHGVCKSMRHYAKSKDPGLGNVFTYEDPWDADKVYGCECDLGYAGYDCSIRVCPTGDDPLTTGDADEVQLMQCSAGGGEFTISFMGVTSEPISVTATAVEVSTILNNMPKLGQVSVTFSDPGNPVCSIAGSQVVSITFLTYFGDVPQLYSRSTHISSCADPNVALYDICDGIGILFQSDGNTILTESSVKGTKENIPCSGRGFCNQITGTCSCYPGYSTSDGRGNSGGRGDCGQFLSEITRCPGEIACSGHGYCENSPTFRCVCSVGWTSGDCSVRTCPYGPAWFDYPIENNRAHQLTECSNMGVCDEITGECNCRLGFEGSACQYFTCPGGTPCSGHGRCLGMDLLAQEARTNGVHTPFSYGTVTPNDPFRWDYEQIQGCLCDEGYYGYDCSLKRCPVGDDPDTSALSLVPQFDEIQVLLCVADGGSLKLKFRLEESVEIAFDASQADLEAAINGIESIEGTVSVTYSAGVTFCTAGGANHVSVQFLSVFGNLPDLEFITNEPPISLTLAGGLPSVGVASNGSSSGGITSVTGTKESEECSNRGICDDTLGVCDCFIGYGSSNGRNEVGDRGDCGWKMDFYSPTG